MAIAAVAALAFAAAVRRPLVAATLILQPRPVVLSVPVRGVSSRQLVDSWGAPRSGGRRHRGIDIFARRGTPVVANTRGLVLFVGHNRLGGMVVRILGPGGQIHYYAHLERFGRYRRGDVIRAGDVLGYVGTTGNARGTPPHLHYGIYVMPGLALNPYPLLRQQRPVA